MLAEILKSFKQCGRSLQRKMQPSNIGPASKEYEGILKCEWLYGMDMKYTCTQRRNGKY